MHSRDMGRCAWIGILAVFIFLTSLLISYLLFPGHYSPLQNWVSDLGNVRFSPQGAIFFNFGCIITGLVFIPFLVALSWWEPNSRKKTLKIAQILGLMAAVFLIMVGVFPEVCKPWHWIWSALFFTTLLFFLVTILTALWNNPIFPKALAYYGILVLLVDLSLITIYILSIGISKPLFEWISVLSANGFILGLSYVMLKNDLKNIPKKGTNGFK